MADGILIGASVGLGWDAERGFYTMQVEAKPTIEGLQEVCRLEVEARLRAMKLYQEVKHQHDALARRCQEQRRMITNQRETICELQQLTRLTVSAEDAVAAIMARADEDGAMHRDAMIEVLRSMGAR